MNKEHMHSMSSEEHANMHQSHIGHRLMMIACCIPMLVIGIVLVATGVVSSKFLIFAVACTLMMAMMMGGMGHGNSKQ